MTKTRTRYLLLIVALALCGSAPKTDAAQQPKQIMVEFLIVEIAEPDYQRMVVTLTRNLSFVEPEGIGKEVTHKVEDTSYNATQKRSAMKDPARGIPKPYLVEDRQVIERILNGKMGKIVTRPRVVLTETAEGAKGRIRLGSDISFRYLKQDNDGRYHVETLTVPEGYDIEFVATSEKDSRVTLMATIKGTSIQGRIPLSGAVEILAGPPMLSTRTMRTVLTLKEGELVYLGGLVHSERSNTQPEKKSHSAYFCRLIPREEAAATRPPGANLKEAPSKPEMRDLTLTGFNPVSLARPLSSTFSSEVLEQVLKSVVKVEARFDRNRETGDGPILTSVTSLSAGFIVRADGYIVTASSAVSGTGEVKVTLSDGRALSVKVRGRDSATGVAVLKVDSTSLPALTWADDENTRIGQPVFIFGHPEGMDNTLLTGIVTAVKRRLPSGLYVEDVVESHETLFENSNVPVVHDPPVIGKLLRSKGTTSLNPSVPLVQTNLPISPGCSGGPVCDSTGAVIGMSIARYLQPSQVLMYDQFGNPARFYQVSEAAPISFAVPVSELRRAVDEIIEKGKVERAWLGIAGQDNTTNRQPSVHGAMVIQVMPGSPAERAGLRTRDVIQKVDDLFVSTFADLMEIMANRRPGDTVHLGVLRDGKEIQLAVVLSDFPRTPASQSHLACLSVADASIQEVAKALAAEFGQRIVLDPGVAGAGPITLTLHDFPFETALRLVCEAAGLEFHRGEDGVYTVTKKKDDVAK